MAGAAFSTIYDVAEDQHGYITTAQAREIGVSPQALHNMTRRGVLERSEWGVYRLVQFPTSENDQYVAASLWPLNTRGVISHESALGIYGLSDANSAKIHLTVPKSFRIRRKVPREMVIHRADLIDDEIAIHDGVPVTTAERTIRDCHAEHLGAALIRQAIADGCRAGILRRSEAMVLERELIGTQHTSNLHREAGSAMLLTITLPSGDPVKLTLNVPENHRLASDAPALARHVALYAALFMFREGELSAGAAAEFAGVDRSTFAAECQRHRIPVTAYPPEDLQAEVESLRHAS